MARKPSSHGTDEALEGILQTLRTHMPELRQRYGVRSSGVFGSYVHGSTIQAQRSGHSGGI